MVLNCFQLEGLFFNGSVRTSLNLDSWVQWLVQNPQLCSVYILLLSPSSFDMGMNFKSLCQVSVSQSIDYRIKLGSIHLIFCRWVSDISQVGGDFYAKQQEGDQSAFSAGGQR